MRIDSELCGWVLVEAQLERRNGRGRACLRGQRHRVDEVFEIFLPVLPNGRIHELVRLPDDVTGLTLQGVAAEQEQHQISHIRRVGWFERIWCMANQVIRVFQRLSGEQRAKIGLSLSGAFFDLPDAYRIATHLRWRLTYSEWIKLCDRLDDEDVRRIRQHIVSFAHPPHFHLLLMADGAEHGAMQATLNSLRQQLYPGFTCTVLDVGAGSAFDSDMDLKDVGLNSRIVAQPQVAAWLDQLNGSLVEQREWLMLLRPGDVLPAHSLYWFACETLARLKAAVLYSDDDVLDAAGQRCEPRFKPDWSLVHLRATHFMGDAVVLRGSEVVAAGGVSLNDCRHGNYDLLLRVVDVVGDEGAGKVAHIPHVLLHLGALPRRLLKFAVRPERSTAKSKGNFDKRLNCNVSTSRQNPPLRSTRTVIGIFQQPASALPGGERGYDQRDWNDSQWCMEALRAHLARNNVAGEVFETLPDCWRVRYRLPKVPPLVSIIVPMRDEPALIRQCVESLLAKTTYPRFEILVVDNQSSNPEALAYLAQIDGQYGIRVLRYDHSFNYSAINNMAVREARGEVACLLNNDTEVISPDWLDEMVGHLLQPKVGVVGAKLYFPNGQIQHGGDLVGVGGVANHAHAFLRGDDPGYCNRAMVAQELSAVTAACLVAWKDIYQRMGGLDEKHLKVAFNDVDYCLRVREAGYHVVWTPHAELYHYESVSRGKDQSPEKVRRARREAAYMRKRWKRVLQRDPFYNPNLSYERPDFSLSHAPLVQKPWLK